METQLQGLLDRAALGELINRYSAAIDQGDWALFRSCFTEQVEVDITDTPVGGAFGARSIAVDDWVKAVANGLADYSRTQHYSNNHVIDLSGGYSDRCFLNAGDALLARRQGRPEFVQGRRPLSIRIRADCGGMENEPMQNLRDVAGRR